VTLLFGLLLCVLVVLGLNVTIKFIHPLSSSSSATCKIIHDIVNLYMSAKEQGVIILRSLY